MRLDNKVAIVTGTSPNIGGGIAECLAAEGAAVVCVDAKPADAAARYLSGSSQPGNACDVRDDAQVQAAVSAAVDFGGVDILVNNAAFFNRKGVLDMPVAEWRDQIDVILTGAFLFTQHVARAMIAGARKGSIINIISTAGHQGEPRNVAYSTAKCGLINFTRSSAMELADKGIHVNSLTPTATDPSESFERAVRWGRPAVDGAGVLKVMESFQFGCRRKLQVPSDYGRAAVFLASDDAGMIAGTEPGSTPVR